MEHGTAGPEADEEGVLQQAEDLRACRQKPRGAARTSFSVMTYLLFFSFMMCDFSRILTARP
jgi:hypothetical protein